MMALLAMPTMAQTKNVARECVLFELFTGVRCPYCPAAANAVAQLLEEGKPIAPVAYHTNAFSVPAYITTETNARASYYGVTTYPTLKADGILSYVGGGSANETVYSYYLPKYNQRINVASPYTIEMTCEPGEGNLWTVHCTVNQVGEVNANDPRIMIALTQCNIDVTWEGMQGLHHVCRDMIPTQMGTVFTGPTMTIDYTFEMNWPKEDCYLTAWVQNYTGTKEVYQAVRLSLDLNLDHDIALRGVSQYAESICSGLIRPTLTVKNCGKETVSTFDVVAMENGTEIYRETWTGSLPVGESMDLRMTEFDKGDASQLSLVVENPNGHADECMGDNSMTIALDEPYLIDGYIKLQVKTDQNPEQTIIQIVDMNTDEMVHELTFDQPSHVYNQEVSVPNASCYRIRVLDTAGDGFTGIIRFTDASNKVFFKVNSTTSFTDELIYEFSCNGLWAVEDTHEASMELYPNPSNGKFYLDLGEGNWQVEVMDISGRLVYQAKDFVKGDIELGCGSGMYLLKAANGENVMVRKVMVY